MIKTKVNDNLYQIKIIDFPGIEDAIMFKDSVLEGLENNDGIELIVETDQQLHISLCLLIYASIKYSKNIKKKYIINDNQGVIGKSLKELGLKKEYEIIRKVN